jgi:hypothetical protein
MYRGTWLLVGVPLLVAALSVARPEPLPPPALPPTFDAEAANTLAIDLAGGRPNRTPGSLGAVDWVAERFRVYGFKPKLERFDVDIPGLGRRQLTNVSATAVGRTRRAIVVLAHRDNLGTSPGAVDNASGTAAMIELARAYAHAPGSAGGQVRPAHDIVFLSTDGGAYGGIGAARFASDPSNRDRLVAVLSLDSVAGSGAPRLELAGDEPRNPPPALVETAAERLVEQTGAQPDRPSALQQLVDLGFPFSLREQAPFVALGIPALTLTTATAAAGEDSDDTDRLRVERLGEIGRASQQLLVSLDAGAELAPIAGGYVYLGPRIVRGWAIQFVLIASVLPFLAAAVDLFARCRRRRIRLGAAVRSLRRRAGFWLAAGVLFWLLGLFGAWPSGVDRPLPPGGEAVADVPVVALGLLGAGAAAAWLITRARLLPRRPVSTEEELAGATASLIGLGVLSLVTIAVNPYTLIFLLPSLHAWIWLPQLRDAKLVTRLGVWAAGLAGPALLIASYATRHDLGLEAPWYLASLVAVGYVEPALVFLFLAWAAAAGQLAAVAARRYAPYPRADELPPGGALRAGGRILAAVRSRRAPEEKAHALEA